MSWATSRMTVSGATGMSGQGECKRERKSDGQALVIFLYALEFADSVPGPSKFRPPIVKKKFNAEPEMQPFCLGGKGGPAAHRHFQKTLATWLT